MIIKKQLNIIVFFLLPIILIIKNIFFRIMEKKQNLNFFVEVIIM